MEKTISAVEARENLEQLLEENYYHGVVLTLPALLALFSKEQNYAHNNR